MAVVEGAAAGETASVAATGGRSSSWLGTLFRFRGRVTSALRTRFRTWTAPQQDPDLNVQSTTAREAKRYPCLM